MQQGITRATLQGIVIFIDQTDFSVLLFSLCVSFLNTHCRSGSILYDDCLTASTVFRALESDRTTMTLQSLSLPACTLVVFLSCMIGRTTANTGYQKPSFFDFNSWWYNQPRGPQIFSCLTYLERYVRVDCEFPRSDKIPGPFCEFKQDGRLMGTTNPNNPVHLIPPVETRRRSNVTLVSPNVCRLTWMPMSDDRAYTYTCRVYQGSTWKENSMSFTQRYLLVCSALNVVAQATLWIASITISLPVSMGLL